MERLNYSTVGHIDSQLIADLRQSILCQMPKRLYAIESCFTIEGRGIVLEGFSEDQYHMLNVGEPIELRRPDGSVIKCVIAGIEYPPSVKYIGDKPPHAKYGVIVEQPLQIEDCTDWNRGLVNRPWFNVNGWTTSFSYRGRLDFPPLPSAIRHIDRRLETAICPEDRLVLACHIASRNLLEHFSLKKSCEMFRSLLH